MPDHLQEKTCRARDEFGPYSPLSNHRRRYGQQTEHIHSCNGTLQLPFLCSLKKGLGPRGCGCKHPSSTVDDRVLYSVYDDELTTAVAIDEILTLVITVVRP